MDWLTFASNVLKFVSDIVGSIAWPGLVLYLLWRFRDLVQALIGEIKPLVHKMSSLKVGALEAKFALDAEKALGDIQAAPEVTPLPSPPHPAQIPLPEVPPAVDASIHAPIHPAPLDPNVEVLLNDSIVDDLPATLELSGVDDDGSTLRNSALIAMAWRDVEGSIDKVAKVIANRFPHNKLHATSKLRAIEASGLLEPRFMAALKSLQTLRNEVIHTPGFEPTDESTKKYLEGVRSAKALLRDAADAARDQSDEFWDALRKLPYP